jgi:hypothetical protein
VQYDLALVCSVAGAQTCAMHKVPDGEVNEVFKQISCTMHINVTFPTGVKGGRDLKLKGAFLQGECLLFTIAFFCIWLCATTCMTAVVAACDAMYAVLYICIY